MREMGRDQLERGLEEHQLIAAALVFLGVVSLAVVALLLAALFLGLGEARRHLEAHRRLR